MDVLSRVVVPLRQPWGSDVVPYEWTEAAIPELIEAAGDVPVLDHWGAHARMTAFETAQPDDIAGFAGLWQQPVSPFSYRYICFESVANVDEDGVRDLLERNNPRWEPDLPELDSIIRQMSAETVGQAVGHILLAAQIAKPGAVHVEERVLISPNRLARVEKGISLAFDAPMSRSRRTGWPQIECLRIRDALGWLLGIPGILQGTPTGPAGRAVSALTHLAMRPPPASEDPVGLMWCMVGLEALYGEGTAHLAQQLSHKSRAVLGEPESFKRAVSRMYEVRSRFIHGDADFPLPYRYDEADPEAFAEPMADAVQLALGILIATLQRLIERGEYHFDFEYRLIDAALHSP